MVYEPHLGDEVYQTIDNNLPCVSSSERCGFAALMKGEGDVVGLVTNQAIYMRSSPKEILLKRGLYSPYSGVRD